MKTSLILSAAVSIIATSAYAGGSHEQPPPSHQPSGYTATANNTAVAGAASQSRATAASQSRSAANAQGGNATAQGGRGGAGGNANASTGPVTVNNTGGGGGYQYQARNNTPDVLAPAINGGNPCTVGASGGLAVPAFGLTFGASGEGQNCVLRANATLLFNMGMVAAAKNMLCQDTHYATAFAASGQPCEADVRRWQQAGYHPVSGGYWSK